MYPLQLFADQKIFKIYSCSNTSEFLCIWCRKYFACWEYVYGMDIPTYYSKFYVIAFAGISDKYRIDPDPDPDPAF